MDVTLLVIPDYVLIRPIGRGAFGEVWLARGVTGQFRAVKILRRTALSNPKCFEREFAGLQRYEPVSRVQANLVHVLHVGCALDGESFWYVMELADPVNQAATDGDNRNVLKSSDESLAAYAPRSLRTDLRKHGRLPVGECLSLALGLTEAVAYLHKKGLVHRDIKPSNIIFVNGTPKLADIGLVALSDEPPSLVGTTGYIPPDGAGTPAADIYALGKVIYEMATGRPLADFPKLPADFERLPDHATLLDLNEVIVRAADPDSRRRYATVDQLRSDLLLLAAGRSVTRWYFLERRVRNAIRVGTVLALVVFVVTGLGLWANHLRKRAEKAELEGSQRFLEQQIALARATRLSGRPGQHYHTLELVRQAAFHTNSSELRSEAIAAMALPDARLRRSIVAAKETNFQLDDSLHRYATNDAAGNIFVHSLEDDRLLATLPGKDNLIEYYFSPDGNSVAATYFDKTCRIHRLEPSANSTPVAFSFPPTATSWRWLPDSSTLVFDETNAVLHFFDARDGHQIRELISASTKATGHRNAQSEATTNLSVSLAFHANNVAFSVDGLLVAAWDSTNLAVYLASTGEELRRWRVPGPPFERAIWHPDGRRLVVLGQPERVVKIWDWTSDGPATELTGHQSLTADAAFDATGQWLATESWDNQTILWNLMDDRPMLQIPEAGNGLLFDHAARRIAWRNWGGTGVRVFELPATLECRRLEAFSGVWAAQPLKFAHLVASVSSDGFRIWQSPFSWSLAEVKVDIGHQLAPAADGGFWTEGNAGLEHWPARLDAQRQQMKFGPPERVSPSQMRIDYFAVARQDTRLLIHSPKRGVWLCPDAARTNWLQLTNAAVSFVTLDGFGQFAAAALPHAGIAVWDGADGSPVTFLSMANVRWCRFSPDGRWLMAAEPEAFLVWETTTWHLASRWSRDPLVVRSFPVGVSGKLMALMDKSSELRLVEIGTWRELARFSCPPLTREVAFSPDGSTLALPCEGSGVELWDLRAVRAHLAQLGCDWDPDDFPRDTFNTPARPWHVTIDPGH